MELPNQRSRFLVQLPPPPMLPPQSVKRYATCESGDVCKQNTDTGPIVHRLIHRSCGS